ncbi:hypothetical protein JHN63_26635 [Streptomyces sp. MBT65]|uniref:hypothetical protein n=1 Tax=Streptomyces sp. MBT65 TaxID=1488395 RepID=UPI00190A9B6D|nr:hypothetical protein [Streptomyces sp. MBT65]MBK3577314.1 hypothetical protein [Streptomyces sp. MBT65]
MPASKVWVTGLTVGAIAAVTVLAVQANKGPHPKAPAAAARPNASASAHASTSPKPHVTAAAVPASSGTGRRIVYAVGQKRVWLVDASDKAARTFAVWPGTVSPDPGTYTVSVRKDATTGSDGVQIENIVYFATKSGLNIAFSNAVDGSSPPAAVGKETGGVRMGKADGAALWAFGTTSTKVIVVK